MSATDKLKCYFKNELICKRAELGISQEKMAENLQISLRSYCDLEHGKHFCSTSALINYVNNCDVDKDKLFLDFAEILNSSEK